MRDCSGNLDAKEVFLQRTEYFQKGIILTLRENSVAFKAGISRCASK